MTPLQVTHPPALSDADVSYVCRIAREAGRLAVEMRDGVVIREKTGPHDQVTEADIQLSKLLTGQIKEQFPADVIISEEDVEHTRDLVSNRAWLIDPIDGTHSYISREGQYSVMIGFVIDAKPIYGWVYAPAQKTMYMGGPGYGTWQQRDDGDLLKYEHVHSLPERGPWRLMMGFRDRKTHPWVNDMQTVRWVKSGSVGLKVAKVLDDQADMFIHLAGKLKIWDTAAPAAIALGAGLEVGGLEYDEFSFDLLKVQQEHSVVIGRPGSIEWTRKNLGKAP
jgi:3'(2'), 5'-bisphosphate nucleotidase